MPHVEIKCYPGRSEAQKQACADRITQAITETMGCAASSVTIAIKEVAQEDWKKDVWDVSIAPEEDTLYKKPGYRCE